jgi:charged multivesicular body protein 7
MGSNPSRTELIYTRDGFIESFATILDEESELSGADFDVLLLYLSRDKGAIAYDGKVSNSLFTGYGYELIGI